MNKYSQAHQRTIWKFQFTSPVCFLDHVEHRENNNQPACTKAGGAPRAFKSDLRPSCCQAPATNLHQSINRLTHSQAARTHSVILPGRFSKRSYVAAAHRTVAMCFCFCAQLSHRKGSHAVNVCGRSAFFLFFFFNSRMWRANSEIEQYENQSPLESRRGAGFDTGGCEVPWVRGRVGS